MLILPEPKKNTPKGCKTAEDEAKLMGDWTEAETA